MSDANNDYIVTDNRNRVPVLIPIDYLIKYIYIAYSTITTTIVIIDARPPTVYLQNNLFNSFRQPHPISQFHIYFILYVRLSLLFQLQSLFQLLTYNTMFTNLPIFPKVRLMVLLQRICSYFYAYFVYFFVNFTFVLCGKFSQLHDSVRLQPTRYVQSENRSPYDIISSSELEPMNKLSEDVQLAVVSEAVCCTCDNIDVECSLCDSCPCVLMPHTSPYSACRHSTNTWTSTPLNISTRVIL